MADTPGAVERAMKAQEVIAGKGTLVTLSGFTTQSGGADTS